MKFTRQKDEPQTSDRPPLSIDTLTAAITAHKEYCLQNRIHWPSEIPYEAREAAQWWTKLQAQPHEQLDRPRQVSVIGGGVRWESPYALRLCHNFRAYCGLAHDDRALIRAVAEDRVYWNGDRIRTEDGKPLEFIRIYDESMKMREMPAREYILKTLREAKRVVAETLL